MSEAKQHDIEKLREHLFATLTGLRDKTLDIATAKTISEVSQTIINSAKVEIEFQAQTKQIMPSNFFTAPEGAPKVTATKHGTLESNGNSTVHRMR